MLSKFTNILPFEVKRFLRKNLFKLQLARLSDCELADKNLILSVEPYTMTSPERLYALLEAVRYVHNNNIPGDFLEAGVWKGGSSLLVAKELINLGNTVRNLYLFDTFSGMPEPGETDISFRGENAKSVFTNKKISQDSSNWCFASKAEVQSIIEQSNYPLNKIHLIQGKVENTIPKHAPEKISILRLDTDWYESTAHELKHLYPRLSSGGVLIIDDYGHWLGARKAVDEFIKLNNINAFLHRVDSTCRLLIKN